MPWMKIVKANAYFTPFLLITQQIQYKLVRKMGLLCIFITRRKGEKEPVIFAVRSEAKLSPGTSGEGVFFSRSERGDALSSAACSRLDFTR